MKATDILDIVSQLFYGSGGGLTTKEHYGEKTYSLSDLLPYHSADFFSKNSLSQGETVFNNVYFLKDNSFSIIYEGNPLVYSSDDVMKSISAGLKTLPLNCIFQIMLFADPYLEPLLDRFAYIRRNSDDVFKMQVEKMSEFIRKGTKGLSRFSGTPVRNYRILLSIKIPLKTKIATSNIDTISNEVKEYSDMRNNFESTVSSTGLQLKSIEPSALLSTLHRFFNNVGDKYEINGDIIQTQQKIVNWNSHKPLNKQIVNAETKVKINGTNLQIGNKFFGCITPKELPKELDTFFNNNFLGHLGTNSKSNQDDIYQIHCQFLYNVTIIVKDLETKIRLKAQQSFIQKTSEQSASKVALVKNEYRWVISEIEQAEKFYDIIPTLWLVEDSEENLNKRVNSVRTILHKNQVDNQIERKFLLPKLLVSSLPAGMGFQDLSMLERNFILQTKAMPYIMGVSAGWKGAGEPYLLFFDRKGQIVAFNFYDLGNNKNFLVTGGSGSGKSFSMNFMLISYIGAGFRVRVIDVGRSYEKQTQMFDGTFIDVSKIDICINFFSVVDDISESLNLLTSIMVGMAYCGSTEKPQSHEVALIETAIRFCFAKKQKDTMIDDIIDFLANMEKYFLDKEFSTVANSTIQEMSNRENEIREEQKEELDKIHRNANEELSEQDKINNKIKEDALNEQLKSKQRLVEELSNFKIKDSVQIGHKLALQLTKFGSQGEYGKYFNGKTNVNISNPIVVIELDGLQDDLKNVIILAFASIISDEIYNGDRKTPTIVLLDEAWQTLENPAAASFVEGLFRKIRKYNGGVGIVTQTVADFLGENAKLSHLANVLKTQVSTHFMLPDTELPNFYKQLGMTDFECEVLVKAMPDTKSIGYRYSEVVIRANGRSMAVRICVETFTYFLNSSDAEENNFIMGLRDKFAQENGGDRKKALADALIATTTIADSYGGGSVGLRNYMNELKSKQ